MIKLLTLPDELLQHKLDVPGSYCYILAGSQVETFLFEHYKRRGLCLKVFEKSNWGSTELLDFRPVIEAARIQNIFALFGLAPIVYRVVILARIQRLAQVTEFSTDTGEPDPHLAQRLVKEFKLRSINKTQAGQEKWDFFVPGNWVGGHFVDFGGWYFGEG